MPKVSRIVLIYIPLTVKIMFQTASDSELKQLLKEVLTETLNEQRELLYEVFTDVLEDVGLAKAIREGQQTEQVDRGEVFNLFE